jgi:aspartokinase
MTKIMYIRPALVNQKSITSIVNDIIATDLSYQDSLQNDYCNFSGLARVIKPEIERLLGRRANMESVVTAIKRARRFYHIRDKLISSILLGSTISVKTDVAKISTVKSKRTVEKVAKALTKNVNSFISVSESISSITLVFDDNLLNSVRDLFASYDILEIDEDLAAIIVHSPEQIIKTPGCAIAFYNQISRRHINIEDTVSCHTDTIMIVKMNDVGRAFDAITKLISQVRRYGNKNL